MHARRPIFLTIALAGLLAPRPLHAQTSPPPLGQVAASFGFGASRLLADPARPRMYAAVPATNSVAVVDTHTLQVIANVFVGSNPVDLSISPDGNTLYTANAGSTTAAIGVIDLNALQALPSLTLANPAIAVAAGLGGRLYVITGDGDTGVYQIDGTTGTVQAEVYYTGDINYLQISPDFKTLYAATPNLASFDVSTSTPAALQIRQDRSISTVLSLRLSHDGRTICRPAYEEGLITLFSATDLTAFFGELNEDNPGPLAFSADDSLVYEATPQTFDDPRPLHVYSTRTFLQTASIQIPVAVSSEEDNYRVLDLTTDATGSYLFISQTSNSVPSNVVVLTTGLGPLTPPGPPVVSIQSDTTQIDLLQGQTGRFTLTRTGDLSQPLTVSYTVNNPFSEQVIQPLKGTKTFKAGHATATINVIPDPYDYYYYGGTGPLKLKITPNAFYMVGKGRAKIILNL